MSNKAPARKVSSFAELGDIASNAPIGRNYDAVVSLKRLKYLHAIVNSPTVSKPSIAEAQREMEDIFATVDD